MLEDERRKEEITLNELKEQNAVEDKKLRALTEKHPYGMISEEWEAVQAHEAIKNALSHARTREEAYFNLQGRIKDRMDGLLEISDGAVKRIEEYADTYFWTERMRSQEKGNEQRKSLLPEGWRWLHYGDGSGALQAPDGKFHFEYDLSTMEFKTGFDPTGRTKPRYEIRDDLSRSAFVRYAEETVMEKLMEQSLQEKVKEESKASHDECLHISGRRPGRAR